MFNYNEKRNIISLCCRQINDQFPSVVANIEKRLTASFFQHHTICWITWFGYTYSELISGNDKISYKSCHHLLYFSFNWFIFFLRAHLEQKYSLVPCIWCVARIYCILGLVSLFCGFLTIKADRIQFQYTILYKIHILL